MGRPGIEVSGFDSILEHTNLVELREKAVLELDELFSRIGCDVEADILRLNEVEIRGVVCV